MKDTSTLQRIKHFIDFKGLSNKNFEIKVGFSNGAFASQLRKNRTIGVDKLENILSVYQDLDPEWLLTGHGSMLKSKSKVILTKSYKGIPLIPFDALAGFSEGSMEVMDYETDRYIVPEFEQLQVDFMIKVKGDSMVPNYYGGNLVACKKIALDTFFQWNKVYVLDTDQGPLIKRVHKSEKDNAVLLVSDNKDYEPFDIALKDVFSLAIVVGMIGFE